MSGSTVVYGTTGRRRAVTDETVVVLAGQQGPAGVSFGFNWRGVWADTTNYGKDDAVLAADGYPYICLSGVSVNEEPSASPAVWARLLGTVTAAALPYDNMGTDVVATNVQDAITELDGELTDHFADGEVDHPQLQRKHGFEVGDDGSHLVTLSYDSSTRQVTLTPVSGSFRFFIDGVEFEKSTPQVTPAHAATYGKHFFYYDANGDLQTSMTPWSVTDRTVTPVALVFYDATGGYGVCFRETHTADRVLELHANLHFSQGTRLLSGGEVADYTLNVDSDAAVTPSIASASIADEDLISALSSLADGGPYKIWYRTGANGEWTTQERALPFDYGTYPRYNLFSGGTWTRPDLASNRFVNYFLVALPAVSPESFRFGLIMGQKTHSSRASADGESLASLSLGELPFEEVAPLYRLTFSCLAGYSGTAKARLVLVTSIRSGAAAVVGSSVSPTIHNALSGRSAADVHPASSVTNTPAGDVAATTVQAAIDELDTDKAPKNGIIYVAPGTGGIAAALAGASDGVQIRLGPGQYSESTIDIPDSLVEFSIVGAGPGVTEILITGGGVGINAADVKRDKVELRGFSIYPSGSNGSTAIQIYGRNQNLHVGEMVVVRDVSIQRNSSSGAWWTTAGLRLVQVFGGHVENVSMRNRITTYTGVGLLMESCVTCRIVGCSLVEWETAIRMTKAADGLIEDANKHGCEGNRLLGVETYLSNYGWDLRDRSLDNVFEAGTLAACTTNGVIDTAASTTALAGYNALISSWIDGLTVYGAAGVAAKMPGWKIIGNTFNGPNNTAINASGVNLTSSDAERCIIKGNLFRFLDFGLYCNGADYGVFIGNSIQGQTATDAGAYLLAGSDDWLCTGNAWGNDPGFTDGGSRNIFDKNRHHAARATGATAHGVGGLLANAFSWATLQSDSSSGSITRVAFGSTATAAIRCRDAGVYHVSFQVALSLANNAGATVEMSRFSGTSRQEFLNYISQTNVTGSTRTFYYTGSAIVNVLAGEDIVILTEGTYAGDTNVNRISITKLR